MIFLVDGSSPWMPVFFSSAEVPGNSETHGVLRGTKRQPWHVPENFGMYETVIFVSNPAKSALDNAACQA
jgi:hypothetical protein